MVNSPRVSYFFLRYILSAVCLMAADIAWAQVSAGDTVCRAGARSLVGPLPSPADSRLVPVMGTDSACFRCDSAYCKCDSACCRNDSACCKCDSARCKRFVVLKTNLAALGLLVANLGVEFSFGRGFSLDLPVYYSPYDITSKFRVRVLGIQPELRYWLRCDRPGKGHFFGLHGTVAGFNVSFPRTDRFQDPERALWGLGLGYGYRLGFGSCKRWGLEFNIGAGYMNYRLDTFENVANGRLMRTGKKHFWGVDRVGVSLTYRFNRHKRTKPEERRPEHE